MNDFNIAFNVYDDAYYALTPVDCIKTMFRHTGVDGMLFIPTWPNDLIREEGEKYYALKMDWNEDDLNKIIAEYDFLFVTLEKIASMHEDVFIRVMRICKLLSMKAPAVLINNDAKLLAQAMVVDRFALSCNILGCI